MKKASLIIPAYNEEEGLEQTLKDIRQMSAESGLDFEIIVIDDGSSDKTKEVAESFGAFVISNSTNMGYGYSLKKGIEAGKNEYLVTLDADATYPAEKIPELINLLDKGFDMAVGQRQGREYKRGGWKDPARLIFKGMAEFVVGGKIPDINSGLRAFRRSRILPLLPSLCSGFSFSTSTTLIFFLKKYPVAYIPADYRKRKGKSKVNYVRDALRTTQILTEIIARYNPVKLFLLLSFIPFFAGLVLLFAGLFWFAFISFLATFFVFCLGLIAKILSRD